MHAPPRLKALEFFAGGGLAGLGLSRDFDVIWANDNDPMKAAAWRANFGETGFIKADIATLNPTAIPQADLAWASFPCQDLSLAGARGGLSAKRSGTFFAFVDIIKAMQSLGTAPKVLVIENVSGLLTSRGGKDLAVVLAALADLGFQTLTYELDARAFVPQSRPRVFIVAAREAPPSPCAALPRCTRGEQIALTDIIDPIDQTFWPHDRTQALLASLSSRHAAQLADIQASGTPQTGTIYRRTRTKKGVKAAYAETRFDGIAGCLRTPSGGSSRQFWIFVEGPSLKIRAINAREAMALMGVADSYILPKSQLAGLKIAGDGVALPVVAWLSENVLVPLVTKAPTPR
jgi:DNA (cytosine-5)-methyltransferase 1